MKIKGNIDILGDENGVKIKVYDDAAVTVICDIHLTPEQFCAAALGRLSRLECDVEVPAPERIGKVRESRIYDFMLPDKDKWQNKFGTTNTKEVAEKFIIAYCPDGWTPALYFGSKNSFSHDNRGKLWAHTTLYRWVER